MSFLTIADYTGCRSFDTQAIGIVDISYSKIFPHQFLWFGLAFVIFKIVQIYIKKKTYWLQ